MDIAWKRNQYHTFIAATKIRVGGNNGAQPFEILQDDEFEYDGSVCKYAGAEHQTPQLRGAIRDGWARLVGDEPEGADEEQSSSVPPPRRPVRQMAKAQSKNTDLSRVQRNAAASVHWDDQDEDVVLQVEDRRSVMDPRTRVGHVTSDHNRRLIDKGRKPVMSGGRTELGFATASDYSKQDHTPISRITTPATVKVDILRNPGAAQVIESRASAEHGAGRFHGDEYQEETYREGVHMRTNVRQMSRGGAVDSWDSGDEGEFVGNVRQTDRRQGQSREGISVRDTSNVRASGHKPVPAVRQQPASRQASVPARTVDRKAVSAPKKKPVSQKASKPAPQKAPAKEVAASPSNPKLRIAMRVCPDFPKDWNFFGSTESKIERVKELGSSADMIDALLASESSTVKKALEKAFPSHFS